MFMPGPMVKIKFATIMIRKSGIVERPRIFFSSTGQVAFCCPGANPIAGVFPRNFSS
jgi:hypothetical protein